MFATVENLSWTERQHRNKVMSMWKQPRMEAAVTCFLLHAELFFFFGALWQMFINGWQLSSAPGSKHILPAQHLLGVARLQAVFFFFFGLPHSHNMLKWSWEWLFVQSKLLSFLRGCQPNQNTYIKATQEQTFAYTTILDSLLAIRKYNGFKEKPQSFILRGNARLRP